MTMEVIQHIELGSAQATITFSSIPSTFTDLVVKISGRSAGDTATASMIYQFNGSTSGYSSRYLFGNGSSASSASRTTASSNGITGGRDGDGWITPNTATSNTFSSATWYIPNYRSSTAKSWSLDATAENNATSPFGMEIIAGLWTGTDPITSITITPQNSNSWAAGSSATLYGIKRYNTTLSPKATGGAISYDSVNNKWVHAFYTSGTFTPTENLTGVEYLVIAGGGSGGNGQGEPEGAGGGGAGGYRSSVVGESSGGGASAESTLSLTSGTNYTVTIGAGGAGVNGYAAGNNGSNSVFGSITATGGGRGVVGSNGATGGSGGGAGAGLNRQGGSGTANQGYRGGNSSFNASSGTGGGGAGSAGVDISTNTPGTGGNGLSSSITGTAVTRAGGGAGADQTVIGTGGSGGGGTSGSINGLMNSGSGGAGIKSTSVSGNGGSGIVIVRYSA